MLVFYAVVLLCFKLLPHSVISPQIIKINGVKWILKPTDMQRMTASAKFKLN
jgi:hypothetical protein